MYYENKSKYNKKNDSEHVFLHVREQPIRILQHLEYDLENERETNIEGFHHLPKYIKVHG